MYSYMRQIEENIINVPENHLILASEFHKKYFNNIPETAYYKSLERLTSLGILQHLTKGVYCRPKTSRFGIVPIPESQITSYFTRDNRGLVIGYRLFNKYGISTQVGKKSEVLTNAITEEQKKIGNVLLRKIDFKLSPERNKAIEALEILQEFSSVEDSNEPALLSYMKEFARSYSDKEMNFVLKNRKYKKSTIAFMKYLLTSLSTKNSLDNYLSEMTKYKIPTLETLP